jgi:diadenylate cyclase
LQGHPRRAESLRRVLVKMAPGTMLREGVQRIIRANRGALIVVGMTRPVEDVCSGGFEVDIRCTAQRLSEIAKMDGAIILSKDAQRIIRANVHLVPDPSVTTEETGTRHRTAERVAKQTGQPVISVSESMRIVTLYLDGSKTVLEEVSSLLFRANQALATLERYRVRLDESSASLSALEIEDNVTVRDAAQVLQRAEMVVRIAEEIEDHITELGSEGRLIELQLDELMAQVEDERSLVVRDYQAERDRQLDSVLKELNSLTTDELLELERLARVMAYDPGDLDRAVSPRGYRLLAKIPRLPDAVIEKLVMRFDDLQGIIGASLEDLDEVEGVGEARARSIKDGLARLAESSLLDRYI